MYFGLDISKWQKGLNIKTAKLQGVDFIIIKAGGGDDGIYTDSCFETFYQDCINERVDIGTYWYLDCSTVEEAIKQADYFCNILKGKYFTYPVYCDFESDSIVYSGIAEEIVKAFVERVWNYGYYCGIYTTEYYRNKYLQNIDSKYPVWLAYWSNYMPWYFSEHPGIWQFGLRTIAGQDGSQGIDGNICAIDYPYIIKELNYNVYKEPEEYTKEEYNIAMAVIRGEYGCGENRKQAIEKAGYNYEKIQTIVDEYFKSLGE